MIEGLLIEGPDFSGKTTLAYQLVDALNKKGKISRYHKEYLTNNPSVTSLIKKGIESPIGEEKENLFTLASIIDISNHKPLQETPFIIMDRNWLSMYAHIHFFYPSSSIISSAEALKDIHIPFRYNIYLTSSPEEKEKRIKYYSDPLTGFDLYLSQNPDLHQRYDKYWINLIPKEEDWLIIDVSGKTKQQILKRSLDYIIKDE